MYATLPTGLYHYSPYSEQAYYQQQQTQFFMNNNNNNYPIYQNQYEYCNVATTAPKAEIEMDVELSDCEDISDSLLFVSNSKINAQFDITLSDLNVFGGDLDESITLLDNYYYYDASLLVGVAGTAAKAVAGCATSQEGCNEDYQADSSTRHGSLIGSHDESSMLNLQMEEIAYEEIEIPAAFTLFGGQGVHVYFDCMSKDSFSIVEEEIMLFDDESVIICMNEQQMAQLACCANANARVILAHPNKQIIVRRALSCVSDSEMIVPFIIAQNHTSLLHFAAE